ncbi:MAG: GFA family protein [Arenicellales bacterium]
MTENRSYFGSCLCEKVRFEITGKIHDIIYCHCSQCRKAQGSAFAANGNVAAEHFLFLSGEHELTGYQSTSKRVKYFCRHCGSPVYSKNSDFPDFIRVRIGSIESDIKERPIAHTFTASKANWEDIEGELPQYKEKMTIS